MKNDLETVRSDLQSLQHWQDGHLHSREEYDEHDRGVEMLYRLLWMI